MESEIVTKVLAQLFIEEGFFSIEDEATSVAECIVGLDDHDDGTNRTNIVDDTSVHLSQSVRERMIEYMDIEEVDADRIIDLLKQRNMRCSSMKSFNCEVYGDSDNDTGEDTANDDDDENCTKLLMDGECELCERYVKLTKHHLIPKSTWPKIQIKLLRSVEAIEDGDTNKARMIVGEGLVDAVDELTSLIGNPKIDRKAAVRIILKKTTSICHVCHSAVHKSHDNIDLALWYNSVEKLFNDSQIFNFCKWQSKQRPGRYAKRR